MNETLADNERGVSVLVQHLERRAVNHAFHALTSSPETAPTECCGVAVERPDESDLQRCDGSLKRNTAFVSKLHALASGRGDVTAQQAVLLHDLGALNGTKYVQEYAHALATARFTHAPEVRAAARVAEALHRRYSTFADQFNSEVVAALRPLFATLKQQSAPQAPAQQAAQAAPTAPSASSAAAAAAAPPKGDDVATRVHMLVRLLLENALAGVARDATAFVAALRELLRADTTASAQTYEHLGAVAALLKRGGEELLAIVPAERQAIYREVQRARPDLFRLYGASLGRAQRDAIKALVRDYYDALAEAVGHAHIERCRAESANVRALSARGTVPADMLRAEEGARLVYERLRAGADSIADCTGFARVQLPVYVDPHAAQYDDQAFAVVRVLQQERRQELDGSSELAAASGLWADEETQRFYEVLPDLAAVPQVLLDEDGVTKEERDRCAEAQESFCRDQELASTTTTSSFEQDVVAADAAAAATTSSSSTTEGSSSSSSSTPQTMAALMATPATNITQLLAKLPYCYNSELADHVAEEFYYMNSKARRDRLLEALLALPRQRPELVPYMARIVAILGKHFETFQATVVRRLINEFVAHCYRKDQLCLEPRLRNARYLCELAKFRACPKSVIVACLRRCARDFVHFNVDVARCILESCGRFLCRSPDTRACMGGLLDTLRRLKAQRLDPSSYQAGLLENAILACDQDGDAALAAAQHAQRPRRKRPLAQQFVQYLLYQVLDESNVAAVARRVRRLPPTPTNTVFLAHTFVHGHRARYDACGPLAELLASICVPRRGLTMRVVDELFEQVRRGLEENSPMRSQQRLYHVRFFAELYRHFLVSFQQLLDMLYMLLAFGHDPQSVRTGVADAIDPPTDCFRVRLVCAVLELSLGTGAVKQSGLHGAKRVQAKQFYLFFLRYVLGKKDVPLDVRDAVDDALRACVDPLPRFNSVAEVDEALRPIVLQNAVDFGSGSGSTDTGDEESDDELGSNGDDDEEGEGDDEEDGGGDDGDDGESDEEDDSGGDEEKDAEEEEGGEESSASSQEDDEDDSDDEDEDEEEEENEEEDEGEWDEEFDNELAMLMTETRGTGRGNAAAKTADMAMPVNLADQLPKEVTKDNKQGVQFTLFPLEVVAPADDPLAKHMVDLKAQRTKENEQMRTMVMSAFKAQTEEEQARALQQLQQQFQPQQARGRPAKRGFVPILYTGP